MSLAFWAAILIAGIGGGAAVLYFAWPDVAGTRDDTKAR